MKYYLPLLILLVVAGIRVQTNCYQEGNYELCKPKFEYNASEQRGAFKLFLENIRSRSIGKAREYLPSPHSELLLGMVIGVDELYQLPKFKNELKRTGTIHVVVVSGFNISLVFGLVIRLLGSQYKFKNMIISQVVTLFYALLSGFDPPVVRAWIMGSIAAWSKFYGRSIDGARLLIFSSLVMILVRPQYLFSLSFQLSVLATLGLILFSDLLPITGRSFLKEDLSATIAAQLMVWPIISYYFGTVSLVSLIINPLILWTVPIATILGGAFVIVSFVSPLLATLGIFVLYPFLDIFVLFVQIFSKLSFADISYVVNFSTLIIYYLGITILYLVIKKKRAGRETK